MVTLNHLTLFRYGLSKEEAESYVLCDTIGSTVDRQWRTEGFRVVGDHEKPLLLQSLWKPREGLARRFEIQRRSWVEERTSRDKDTITAGTAGLLPVVLEPHHILTLCCHPLCIRTVWLERAGIAQIFVLCFLEFTERRCGLLACLLLLSRERQPSHTDQLYFNRAAIYSFLYIQFLLRYFFFFTWI